MAATRSQRCYRPDESSIRHQPFHSDHYPFNRQFANIHTLRH